MAVFRIIPGQQYTGNGMIAYIYNKEIHDGMIIPFSVGADPANGYTDFMLTKLLYNKPGGVQYKQFMLSLTQKETIDDFYNRPYEIIKMFTDIADEIACKFGVQIMGAIHGNTDNIHAHYILNSVSFVDGHKIQISKKDLFELKCMINEYLYKLGLIPINISDYEIERNSPTKSYTFPHYP